MSEPVTPRSEIEHALEQLHARRGAWVEVDTARRAALLRACIDGVRQISEEWVRRAQQAQRLKVNETAAGEPWWSGPLVTLRALRTMAETMDAGGEKAPTDLRQADGRWIAAVSPAGLRERLVHAGVRSEVWMQPGRPASQGRIYREKREGRAGDGGVALVLGAGNVGSITPRDLVQKLFGEDEVVVLKMHPLNDYLGPLFEKAFAPLVKADALRVVYGAADAGRFLCRHPLVDSVHVTGSHRTYDAIVWGDSEQEISANKAAGTPVVDKPVTAELGCVSPIIIVPGTWSEADMRYQARSVAGMVANNASFNCNAAKVLVLQRDWPQRQAFLNALRAALGAVPQRYAYYPGSEQRFQAFCDRYPQAERLGTAAPEDCLPWTLIEGVPPDAGEHALQVEAFCGVLATVELDATTPAEFLDRAVDFANERLWGSLSCGVIVDPGAERLLGERLQDAVARLRYGGIAVNCWAGTLFGLCVTSWGAYPGNPFSDIGSGTGAVGNALLFDWPEKSVAYAPFRMQVVPPWFADHRNYEDLGRRMAAHEAAPAWSQLPGLTLAALRG